jgi:hypothetical protein
MEHIKDTITGAVGITAVQISENAVNHVDFTDPNLLQVLIQIVIGIATLLKLFKKPKT